MWTSSTPTTEIAFRFLPDGRFRSVEILSYEMPRGVFEFRRVQDGTATVDGNRLELRPVRSTRSRTNPEDPAGDYSDRPEPLKVRAYRWQVDGQSLRLASADGIELILVRQP